MPDEKNRLARRTVFFWAGLTLLYLWGDLNLNIKPLSGGNEGLVTPWGIPISGITENKFLVGLLIINATFWGKLIWLFLLIPGFKKAEEKLKIKFENQNKNSSSGERPSSVPLEDRGNRLDGFTKTTIKALWWLCTFAFKIDKWAILGIPFIMGLSAIVWLSIEIWG